MRIAIISEVIPETRAGNYIHFRLGVELARRGHEVFFLYPHYHWTDYKYVSEMRKLMKIYTPKEWRNVWDESDVILYLATPYTWIWEYKEMLMNIKKLPYRTLVYIALDYWEGWHCEPVGLGRPPKEVSANERIFMENAAIVTAVSPQLCEYLSTRYNRRVYWLPNATAIKEIAPIPDRREKYAVVVSSLWEGRAPQQYLRLALKYKDWQFFWFGVRHDPKVTILWEKNKTPPNLHFCGEVGNTELSWILSKAMVAIVIAGANPFSYFADPTKWYLYHAARLPIVSLNTPHHKRFPQIYPNTFCDTDLERAFKCALENGKLDSDVMEQHDWEHRAYALEKLITENKAIYGYAENGKFTLTWTVGMEV